MKRLAWIVVLLLMFPGMGRAAERLLYDGVMTTEDASNAFYWFGVPEACPVDWTAPDDFLAGQWHARYEILEQPSYSSYGEPTGLQSCIWQDGKGGDYPETCGSVHFLDGPGVLVAVETPADWWEKADSSASAAVFDWTRGGDFVDLGSPTWHRNEDGSRCLATIASWGGCEENMDAHLPMTLRISIVIVSAGSVFSGWDAYGLGESGEDGGPSDAGSGEDAGLDAGVEDASDAGLEDASDAGPEDASDAGPEDAGVDAGEDSGLDADHSGGDDASTAGDGEGSVDGGCACGSGASPAGRLGLFWLLLLVAGRRLTRR